MKKRSSEILKNLINQIFESPISISYLANRYGVTEKTIRNDINDINFFCRDQNKRIIEINSNGIINLSTGIDIELIRDKIANIDTYIYKMTSEERVTYLFVLILISKKPIKTADMADSLNVGDSTIANDILRIKNLATQYNVKIGANRFGIYIRADEYSIRLALQNILENHFNLYNNEGVFINFILKKICVSVQVKMIIKIINNVEKQLKIELHQMSYSALLIYLLISTNRISQGFTLGNVEIQNTHSNIHYKICNLIQDKFGPAFNDVEKQALSNWMAEKNIIPLSQEIYNCADIYYGVAKFIFLVSKEISFEIYSDYTLFEMLCIHLRALESRHLEEKQQNVNPYQIQIEERYTELVEVVRNNKNILEDYIAYKLDDNEITYIAMYIAASIERNRLQNRSLKVIIACPGSMATSSLLFSQIQKHFDFNILGVYSAHNFAHKTDIDVEVDLIISTAFIEIEDIPVIVVSPLLRNTDIQAINVKSFDIFRNKPKIKAIKETKKNIHKSLDYALSLTRDKEIREEFEEEISRVIDKYVQINNFAQKQYNYLYEILQPELIQISNITMSWEESIRFSGQPLVEQNYIEEEYINLVLENAKQNGPYFVIQKGIALAHAKPMSTVNRIGISLAIFPNGVISGNASNDPVYLLFTFCTNQMEDYLNMLNSLIKITSNQDFIEKIICLNTNYDIFAAITTEEKGLNKGGNYA